MRVRALELWVWVSDERARVSTASSVVRAGNSSREVCLRAGIPMGSRWWLKYLSCSTPTNV